jgi:soluble lytic murein transglycosylase-like protein
VEHIGGQLAAAAALHAANALLAATRMLDRLQPHVTEALAWALDAPSPLAARAYASITWACMPILAPRLDVAQRQAFCEVPACSYSPVAGPCCPLPVPGP